MNVAIWVTIIFTLFETLCLCIRGISGFTTICSENEADVCGCKVSSSNKTPWPAPDEITAPPPTLNDIEYYVDSNRRVVLNITWWQFTSQLKGVTGYFFELNQLDSNAIYKRLVELPSLEDCKKYSVSTKTYFNYAGFGSTTEEVLPHRTYGVYIQATPLYHDGAIPSDDYKSVKVEDCSCQSDDPLNIYNVNYCIHNKERLCPIDSTPKIPEVVHVSSTTSDTPLDHQVTIIAISLFASILLLMLAIILFVPKFRHKFCENFFKVVNTGGSDTASWKHILVLGELYGKELYKDLVLQIARLIHKHKPASSQVDCNLWNMSQDPVKWLQDSLTICDHVVLITPLNCSSHNEQQDPFRTTYDWLQNGCQTSKLQVSIVSLEPNSNSKLTLSAISNNSFISVHNYMIMSKFDDLVRKVIGKSATQLLPEEMNVIQTSYNRYTDTTESHPTTFDSVDDENHTSMVHLMHEEFQDESLV